MIRFRVFGPAAAAALLLAAAPAAAQQFSDSYNFLEAVKKSDGPKVNEVLSDKTNSIINAKDRAGDGALHIVANRSDIVYLRVLLQQPGININLQDRRGNTALTLAAARGWDEGVTVLIKYGANVNLANSGGETPLILGVQVHKIGIVSALLDAGGDPDRPDAKAGLSARDYARQEARYTAIAKLLADAPKAGKKAAAVAGPKL